MTVDMLNGVAIYFDMAPGQVGRHMQEEDFKLIHGQMIRAAVEEIG